MPKISSIKYDGKQKFKKDKFIDEHDIEYTIEGEWLDGVPHGICILENEDIHGIYTFTKGKVHGGPSWFQIKENGTRFSS